ncbi:uncharacterized protein M421DRAFT_10206 [Didymella exigua CBS 183.55]|uniref:Heme oxygenase-like protein n=1 Tax=Didymella exigua CBS 183.55 TaxID=1150837 RepID=A0A6A5R7A4_9PLEO|nr:uncharacterized protein M421DRAFT_10206 [Didymella exigua CBS 183.55]KAF1922854.1 hypothetical protein M421DRAFT_10206 [Didymella exigua CBS 183.55]
MYIIQTTTAIFIAFLALVAWSEVRNRLAKGRSRSKDPEAPDSLRRLSFKGWRLRNAEKSPQVVATQEKQPVIEPSRSLAALEESAELKTYKQLYYKLHNLEQHPEILPECLELFVSLLASTIIEARESTGSTILVVDTFSRRRLDQFLKAKDEDCTSRWEAYLSRRKAGGSREIFGDKKEAKWWLKQAAPVKYVDGAWLGHINKITTPFKYRKITKNAWQVMSEELGDGDLAKNHVYVYRQLMDDIDAKLPAADSEDFIDPRHQLDQTRCWKAAMAQLLISLFPHDFMPESLGFNMAYESLPLHLLKTVKELREVYLNPYYFELHISIDNADSGHAAMAMAAVSDYIDLVEKEEGAEAAHIAWRRCQAGYILAEGLPTTPESPSLKVEPESPFPRTEMEGTLLDIFAAKTFVAHKIHCNSRLKIGCRSLIDWLEPRAFADKQWQKEFLVDLGNCKPWVIKGDSEKSRLVRELSWEGKMFGSFTQNEVGVVKAWIDELGAPIQTPKSDPSVYYNFTKQSPKLPAAAASTDLDVLVDYPTLSRLDMLNIAVESKVPSAMSYSGLRLNKTKLLNLLPLWFTSPTLLESLPSVPVRAADAFGSALVRVLRAQTGFDVEGQGVAGMDEVHRTDNGESFGIIELGLEICSRANIRVPTNLKEVVSMGNAESVAFSQSMVGLSMRWLSQRDVLIGMSWAFIELHEAIARLEEDQALLSSKFATMLEGIAQRERSGLNICKEEIEMSEQRRVNFERGLAIARRAVACVLS